MKTIAVYCSANNLADNYVKPAQEFARLLGENRYNLVWGGSDRGLMKVMAEGVEKAGGKIYGVSMKILEKDIREGADEMVIAKDLAERKALMLQRADALVVLVGGIGTLDEITEALELKKHGIHTKPIVILNTAHFYDGLKQQFEKMETDGFLPKSMDELLYFAQTPQEVITYLQQTLH